MADLDPGRPPQTTRTAPPVKKQRAVASKTVAAVAVLLSIPVSSLQAGSEKVGTVGRLRNRELLFVVGPDRSAVESALA